MQRKPLAFVDLETTGATVTHDRITEIGIVEVDTDGTVREWQQLVNPGMRIPPFIEKLTGISNEMVADAPPFEAVAAEALKRLEGRLFIAHNARFDYGFLKREFKRVGVDFRASVVCTVKLSRALFPEHRRHNLDTLIERHGLRANARHRALADAQLIYQFWQKIQVDRSNQAFEAALEIQNTRPTLPAQLAPEIIDELPETPGVYLFYGDADTPLYIGKAKDIRKRALSHFTAARKSPKDKELARQTRRLEWIETSGEIGTLLKEAALVKAMQPIHNRHAGKKEEMCSWRLLDEGEGRLRLQLWSADEPGFNLRSACYGLFRSRKEAVDTLRRLADAHHLCASLIGLENAEPGSACAGFRLKRCKGACIGREPLTKHGMRLIGALASLRLLTWPFAGPAMIREGDEVHLIDNWRHLGTAKSEEDMYALLDAPYPSFEREVYAILSRHHGKMTPLRQKQRFTEDE